VAKGRCLSVARNSKHPDIPARCRFKIEHVLVGPNVDHVMVSLPQRFADLLAGDIDQTGQLRWLFLVPKTVYSNTELVWSGTEIHSHFSKEFLSQVPQEIPKPFLDTCKQIQKKGSIFVSGEVQYGKPYCRLDVSSETTLTELLQRAGGLTSFSWRVFLVQFGETRSFRTNFATLEDPETLRWTNRIQLGAVVYVPPTFQAP